MVREQINGEWIARRLAGLPRGTQAKLARQLGLDNDKMSKTIRGERSVQSDEVIPLLTFFGYTIIPPDAEFSALYKQWQELATEDRAVLRAAARGLRADPD